MSLIINIKNATNLKAADSNGFSDPYTKVEVNYGTKKVSYKTKIIKKTLNPEWNETFVVPNFTNEDLSNTSIKFVIFDWDLISLKGDDYIGVVLITKQQIEANLKVNEELLFSEDVSEGTGKLNFTVTYSNEKIEKRNKRDSLILTKRESVRNISMKKIVNPLDEIKILKEKYEKLTSENSQLKDEKEVLLLKAKELDERIKTETVDIKIQHKDALIKSQQEFEETIKKNSETYEQKIQSLENQLKESDEKHQKAKVKHEEQIKKLEQELFNKVSSSEEVEKLKKIIEEKDALLMKKKQKKQTLKQMFEQVKQEGEKSSLAAKNLKDEKVKLEDNMKKLQMEYDSLNDHFKEKVVLVNESKDQIQKLELEIKKLSTQVGDSKKNQTSESPLIKESISKIVKNDPSYIDVVLVGCGVTDNHLKEICQAVLKNKNILKLDFSNNPDIKGECVAELTKLINETKTLTELIFDGCLIAQDKITIIKKSLEKNQSLVQCTLGKFETEDDIVFIESIMERNFEILSKE